MYDTEKEQFFDASENLTIDTILKIILSDHQNNGAGILSMISSIGKSLNMLTTSLSILHNVVEYLNLRTYELYQGTFFLVSTPRYYFSYVPIFIFRYILVLDDIFLH